LGTQQIVNHFRFMKRFAVAASALLFVAAMSTQASAQIGASTRAVGAQSPPSGAPADCPPWICKKAAPKPKAAPAKAAPAKAAPAKAAPAPTLPGPTASIGKSAAPEVKKKKPKKKRGERRFIEGELANVGSIGLTPWENRFGIVMGAERLGFIYYGLIRPEINYTRDLWKRELSLSFAIPLRLEILDTRPERPVEVDGKTKTVGRFSKAGQFRKADWNEVTDYAQIIRYINFGGKEEHFYLDINAFKASSIGHGTVLKRYNPNLDLNRRRVSFELDAFSDYVGFESYLNSIAGPEILGGLLFVKPLSLIDRKNYMLRSFSIGASFAADIDAPMRNLLDFDDEDDDGRHEREIAIDQETFQPKYLATEVISYGLSTEIKLVDTPKVDWKTYFDTSFIETGVPTDDENQPTWENVPTKAIRSSGMIWGNLLRLNFDRPTPESEPLHALRIRTELRRYDNNYLPSYFDTMYEVQRVQYLTGASGMDLANGTKLQRVLGRNPTSDPVHGLYFEASWKMGNYLAMAFAIEVNDREDPSAKEGQKSGDNNFFFHMEIPHIGNWQFLATYHRRTAKSLADMFSAEWRDNDIIILKTRYRLADAIHFNMEAITPFGIGPDSLFRNTINLNFNAEFGFSYGDRNK